VKRFVLALPLVLVAVAAAGCGSSDAGGNVDQNDLPAVALDCIQQHQIGATRTGAEGDEIVLDAGPKIKFYLTADEAIGAQFRGRAEGSEQIGSALLYVDPDTSKKQDDMLHDVEICLASL
jgi:hypothetical protein